MNNTEQSRFAYSNAATGAYPAWLKEAVFYQIYPQSFYDSNGDGIGDIPGIIQKLDYLEWLGVNAVWINPCFVSPFQDAGYDVADYYRVAPRYGTNRDLYRLCREAHKRGIRICLDLVAGHTSTDHPWFKASGRKRRNRYSDRYVWTPPEVTKEETGLSLINGVGERGENYVANCFDFQPALNYGFAVKEHPWQQPVDASGPQATRRDLVKIMDFWLGHGADGFRVDMAFSLVKNDPDRKETIRLWQDIMPEIRAKYPDTVMISEWGNPEESIAAGFDIDFMLHFGVGGYPDLMLNENCFFRRTGGTGIKVFLDSYLRLAAKTEGRGLISVPSANHDFKRPRSDGRTIEELKVIFAFLLTWPGVPFIYYGDEIGMKYVPDIAWKEGGFDRTGTRTPMQWNTGKNAGFSTAGEDKLYLPVDPDTHRPDVETQSEDDDSLLNHVRRLIALRKQHPALQSEGKMTPVPVEDTHRHFCYVRQAGDERFLILVNPSDKPSQVHLQRIETEKPESVVYHGITLQVGENDIFADMDEVSYGVFRLS
ncbi:MAG: alpha-glucosidase C-terminal domain-containing protein [Dehalococcoidales bacterium]|nr:alpha-glucosidase C-terminal domain-containing protein [Dehalococcoidales bacterium]